jgi:O-antigen/teichoic acid export membrane protein
MTVSGVLLPLLARVEQSDEARDRLAPLFTFAVALLIAVALPVAVFGGLLAPGIVHLVYGAKYHRAILLLQILLPAFVPICLGYVFTGQLILHGMLRPYIGITLTGAIVNVAANVILIPRFGAPAAAWTTVGTECLVIAGIIGVVRYRLGLALPVGRAVRCAAAVLLAGVPVWLVRHQPIAIGLLVAVCVYPPLLLASRAVTISELRGLLSRRTAVSA